MVMINIFLHFEEAKESSHLVKYDGNIQYDPEHLPNMKQRKHADFPLNFSLLEDYFECPYRFKLSMFYGFEQPVVPALGYGNVLHEIVKNIHIGGDERRRFDQRRCKRMIDESFYFPYATRNWKKICIEECYKSN